MFAVDEVIEFRKSNKAPGQIREVDMKLQESYRLQESLEITYFLQFFADFFISL